MELNLATIASSSNIQIAIISAVAWFSKSLISLAAKGYAAFVEDRAQTHAILDKQNDILQKICDIQNEILAEQKNTNELLKEKNEPSTLPANNWYNIPPPLTKRKPDNITNV